MIAIRSLFVAALLIGNAHAVDYTINVPVKVTAATDDILPLSVYCYIGIAAGNGGIQVFAQQQKQLPIVEGTYTGPVTLVLKLTDQQAMMPLIYECRFYSHGTRVEPTKTKPNSGSVLWVNGPAK
jgi:hypothetical protein